MSAEFTGERVIPGQVDVDLWNEHLSRYAFAARLSRRKRVLDVGCGAGYGSAELANTASTVTGIDISEDAVAYAAQHYVRPNLQFQHAGAAELPFPDGSFDLVVAFEVIEHLTDWPKLIKEARRVLSPGGQFVVSTPNKAYYAESRRLSGPNPFHEHEFEFDEFRLALEEHFPHTLLFTENHSDSIVFRPVANGGTPAADVRLEGEPAQVDEAHFFIAVCAGQLMTGAPAFLYVPSAANVLRERERHIQRLEGELATKDGWLRESQEKHATLVELHDQQTAELKDRNAWAMDLNQQLQEAGNRITALQAELETEQAAATETVAAYEKEIKRVNAEQDAALAWGKTKETELLRTQAELATCVELLDKAEKTVEERTLWAQSLDAEIVALRQQLDAVRGSRWMRLGRSIGVGPKVQ
ncbi:MAG: methyltransferase domain-containing protein [Acidobacteria bacterium]|nr:methyltransferase domain-containing protein [Acidobacteriota bacterium]